MHLLSLALASAALLGFRHGFDYDHIAAISDLSAAPLLDGATADSLARRLRPGMVYIAGHAATVCVLATLVLLFRLPMPAVLDRWAERLVGLTLLLLGVVVLRRLGSAREHDHDSPWPTRLTLLANGALWLWWRLRGLFAQPMGEPPRAFAAGYRDRSSFLVGVLHGLGAETPTQILLFLLTAHLGGRALGFLGLACFLAGLVTMNTLMCAAASGVLGRCLHHPRSRRLAGLVTVAYSLAMGLVFLAGASGSLPALS